MGFKSEIVRVLLSAAISTGLVEIFVAYKSLPLYFMFITFIGSYLFCYGFSKFLTGEGRQYILMAMAGIALIGAMFYL
jgi:hypothetical protein